MLISKANYCFQKRGIWYYKKRIPKTINQKSPTFKISMLALLGKKSYYSLLMNNSLFQIISYLNNKVELYFLSKEYLTMAELSEYAKNLISRYEQKAMNLKNDFLNESLEYQEIEKLRYEGLSFYDEESNFRKGHTKAALQREQADLENVFDEDEEKGYLSKMNDILKRQNIIKNDEIKQLSKAELPVFAEYLVKKEIEVISQELKNRNNLNKNNGDLNKMTIDEFMKQVVEVDPGYKVWHEQGKTATLDNKIWSIYLKDYLRIQEAKQKSPGNFRAIEAALTTFKQILEGDENLNIPKRFLTELKKQDIDEIKLIIRELPSLKNFPDWREKGILHTIEYAKVSKIKSNRKIGGLNGTIQIFINFLKELKLYAINQKNEEKLENLKIELFETLKLKIDDLTEEAKIFNDENKKEHFEGYILNHFLLDRYDEKTEATKGQAARNFTYHTNHSPNIFWAPLLGIYTGARPDELSNLEISDIGKKEYRKEGMNLYYFKIRKGKTENAKRIFPISKFLIDLGFFNYIQSRINQKAKMLFDLENNREGEFQRSYNDNIKPFVNKYYKEEYKDKADPTYYDLRSYFISQITDNNEDSFLKFIFLKKMVGHSTEAFKNDITLDRYNRKPLNLKKAYDLINMTDFEIDEAFNFYKEKMTKKYGEIQRELNI